MTDRDRVPPARIGFEESFHASLHHVALLRQHEARLAAARADTEAQLLHQIGSAYRCGDIDDEKLLDLFIAIKAARLSLSRWDEHVPIPWRQMMQAEQRRQRQLLLLPNGPEGSWVGPWPLGYADHRPELGQAVVYVLYDSANEPCYVGSTERFAARLREHDRAGKVFVRWLAHPCVNRRAAYALEDRLLREYLPQLNRKASR